MRNEWRFVGVTLSRNLPAEGELGKFLAGNYGQRRWKCAAGVKRAKTFDETSLRVVRANVASNNSIDTSKTESVCTTLSLDAFCQVSTSHPFGDRLEGVRSDVQGGNILMFRAFPRYNLLIDLRVPSAAVGRKGMTSIAHLCDCGFLRTISEVLPNVFYANARTTEWIFLYITSAFRDDRVTTDKRGFR